MIRFPGMLNLAFELFGVGIDLRSFLIVFCQLSYAVGTYNALHSKRLAVADYRTPLGWDTPACLVGPTVSCILSAEAYSYIVQRFGLGDTLVVIGKHLFVRQLSEDVSYVSTGNHELSVCRQLLQLTHVPFFAI
jgi:hypothetical protein